MRGIVFLIVASCSQATVMAKPVVMARAEPVVHEMNAYCEVVPRVCFEECNLGIRSSCPPTDERAVVSYR